jgi:hypothetical protein
VPTAEPDTDTDTDTDTDYGAFRTTRANGALPARRMNQPSIS